MAGERCWYSCVSNMYLHAHVRLAGTEEMAPDAKEADEVACLKARLRKIGYCHLTSFCNAEVTVERPCFKVSHV